MNKIMGWAIISIIGAAFLFDAYGFYFGWP